MCNFGVFVNWDCDFKIIIKMVVFMRYNFIKLIIFMYVYNMYFRNKFFNVNSINEMENLKENVGYYFYLRKK